MFYLVTRYNRDGHDSKFMLSKVKKAQAKFIFFYLAYKFTNAAVFIDVECYFLRCLLRTLSSYHFVLVDL